LLFFRRFEYEAASFKLFLFRGNSVALLLGVCFKVIDLFPKILIVLIAFNGERFKDFRIFMFFLFAIPNINRQFKHVV